MRTLSSFILSFTLMTSPAFALGDLPMENLFTQASGGDTKSMGADMALVGIGEDFFLQLSLNTELNLGKIGLGLQVPLNLRVIDKDPKSDNDYYGLIRHEDWDETSEYFRVIRYARFGHKRDPFYIRVGELAADIGHGTIVGRYLNNIDIDTFRVGMQLDINSDYGGIETLVSDLGSVAGNTTRSQLLGGRLYVKPMAVIDPSSMLNIFSLGFSAITDLNAPSQINRDVNGAPLTNADGQLDVSKSKQTTVYGLDLDVDLLHNAIIDLVPYADLNKIENAGWGLHVGAFATIKLPIGLSLQLPIRAEYRRFKENYIPIYFSEFYEIERYLYPLGSDASSPKGALIRNASGGDGLNGYYAQAAFDFVGLVQIGAIYEDYNVGDPNLAAFVGVPALEIIDFKAYYARTGITGTDDIFKLDDRSMAIAQGQYEVIPFVFVVAQFSRQWVLTQSSGQYESTDSWKFGVSYDFNF
ncbi:MAG: hypothetical protein QGI45_12150 [Myxococcota bacterium]|nr:hypothetical protein [Myxococcota bacterium]